MEQYTVLFLPDGIRITVPEGTTLLQAQTLAGLHPDAPCGGRGTCGKCLVTVDGAEVRACCTEVHKNLTVRLPQRGEERILTQGLPGMALLPDAADRYVLAFDIGTTTLVCFLLDGSTGGVLSRQSCLNPQTQYGADVISRIQHAKNGGAEALQQCIRQAMAHLVRSAAEEAGIRPGDITCAAVAGNTAMHHLLLGIDPKPLATPPYMPAVSEAMEVPAAELLPFGGTVRLLPNIAGFVGGDTVACLSAVQFDRLDELTLLLDIGTNGELVLGDSRRRIACSTAAGPAFEGAKISCGMRGAEGAVDHVWLEDGEVRWHVIGEKKALGLCGSGLLDLVAVLLELELIDESGRLTGKTYRLGSTDVVLTQKDIREVQLAKAAIRAGIELLADTMSASVADIRKVCLAGAFGNYMNPASACRIGMIPACLEQRIVPIGNAAGEGAKRCALSRQEYEHAKVLAADTEFLELASLPDFQDCYLDVLEF